MEGIKKQYLGDGVYIGQGACLGDFVLTTENGIETTNRITLEREVVEELLKILSYQYPQIKKS